MNGVKLRFLFGFLLLVASSAVGRLEAQGPSEPDAGTSLPEQGSPRDEVTSPVVPEGEGRPSEADDGDGEADVPGGDPEDPGPAQEPSSSQPGPPAAPEPDTKREEKASPAAADPEPTPLKVEPPRPDTSTDTRSPAMSTVHGDELEPWSAHDPKANRVTLERAIGMAVHRHPRLIAARHQTASAEARVGEARAAYYPQVNAWLQTVRGTMDGSLTVFHSVPGMVRVGGSNPPGVGPGDSFNNFLAAATVHQLLYDFGRTQGAVASQRALVEATKMNERLIEQQVIFAVTRTFYDVLEKRDAVVVAEDALRLTQRVLELAEAGKRAGLRPPSESARAEADVATAELGQIRARAELDVARAALANAVGMADMPFEPVGEIHETPVPLVEAKAIAIALRHRPELHALEHQLEALAERLRSEYAEHYPRIEALAGINSRGQYLNGADVDFAVHNWNIGVVLQLPIFQGGRISSRTKALRAEILALESSQETVRQAVVLEVKQAVAQLRFADEGVRASQKGVDAAKIALETTEERYRTGLGSLIEMIDAQTAYISALSEALRASYHRRFARAALEMALGTLEVPPEAQ